MLLNQVWHLLTGLLILRCSDGGSFSVSKSKMNRRSLENLDCIEFYPLGNKSIPIYTDHLTFIELGTNFQTDISNRMLNWDPE